MRWIAVAIPAGLLVVFVLSVVLDYNLNFDEGYNLQIPLNLLRHGRYGSETLEGFRDFDPLITTGPLVLVPIAPVLALFGVGITQARVIPALYALALVGLIAGLTWRRYGPAVAAYALTLLLTIKDIFLMLGNVLGETGGLVWWLIGIALLTRLEALGPNSGSVPTSRSRTPLSAQRRGHDPVRRRDAILAGVAFGLAIWAKPSLAAATLTTAGVLLVWAWRVDRRWLWATASALLIGGLWFALPPLVGVADGTLFSPGANGLIAQQLDFNLATNVMRNTVIGWSTLMLPILASSLWLSWRSWRERECVPLLVGLTPVVWVLGWLLFNRNGVMRHVLPALMLGVLPVAIWAAERGASWRRSVALAGALVVLLGVSGSGTGFTDYFSRLADTRERRAAQLALADAVRRLPEDAAVYGWGWYRAWDIVFLAERVTGDLQGLPAFGTPAHLILTPTLTRDASAEQALSQRLATCQSRVVLDAGFNYRLIALAACPK